jgi:hypothetical protein
MEPGEVTELPMWWIQNGIDRNRFIARPHVFQNTARQAIRTEQPAI